MEENIYYQMFAEKLEQELLRLCTEMNLLKGSLLTTEDFDRKWKEFAPEYMADSVKEIALYPDAAVAWAGYAGMAVARWWHDDWKRYSTYPYGKLHGKRGFDDMDEHILYDILGLKKGSGKARQLEEAMKRCATRAIGMIRHENIEPQSQRAFYVYAQTEKVMFRIGASLILHQLGYHWQEVPQNQ